MSDFHDKPFDEHTLVKLQIFELYAQEWLPVFLASPQSRWEEIHIFDFFAGPGLDQRGEMGSPLRILRTIRRCLGLRDASWPKIQIVAHFYDIDASKIEALTSNISSRGLAIKEVTLDVRSLSFESAITENATELWKKNAAKLLLIDQCGVDQVTREIFRDLVAYPTTDFLFFISSSTLHRFHDHPAIKLKIERPADYYHVHRKALEYYRELLPTGSEYYLAPFSIKKERNIYGLIFGSGHPLGMDKFLRVAWNQDRLNGEADYDINRDDISPDEILLPIPEILPRKVWAFEQELARQLKGGICRDEGAIIRLCFEHGVTRQHAASVLRRLKSEGVITTSIRVPDIRNLNAPRPVFVTA